MAGDHYPGQIGVLPFLAAAHGQRIFSAYDTSSRKDGGEQQLAEELQKKNILANGIELRLEPSKLHHMEIKLATAVIPLTPVIRGQNKKKSA